MTLNIPAILSLLTDAIREGATPEDRRESVEQVLREISPLVEDALADRPVVRAAWALLMDSVDAWEGGLSSEEAAELVKGVGEVVALAVRTPFVKRPKKGHMGLKALLSIVRASGESARQRAADLSPGVEIVSP